MKSEIIPFLVIGSIFVADHVENFYLDQINRQPNRIDERAGEICTEGIVMTQDMIDLSRESAHSPGETFEVDGLVYNFEEPIFSRCVGKDHNEICAKDGEQFITFWYVIRNDTDREIISYPFSLSHKHSSDASLEWWKTQSYNGQDALWLSGMYEEKTLKPNMQMRRPVVFSITDDTSRLELRTPKTILAL